MKKWIGPLISLLLILILGIAFVSGSFSSLEQTSPGRTEGYSIIRVQDEKEKGDADPYLLQIWKEIQKGLDEWLRRLNDKIESEDVTRFGVRFLEILRNMLEWMKERVDGKIQFYEKEKPMKEKKSGTFRETRRDGLPFAEMG